MLQNLREISPVFLCTLFLGLFFGVEALNKIQLFYTGQEIEIQKYVKLGALMFFILMLFFRNKKALIGLMAFSACFAIGQCLLPEKTFAQVSLVSFSRYLFFLSLIIFFSASPINLKNSKGLQKMFKTLLIGNSILILLASVFQLLMFKSYEESRFGYNGLFMASATSTYFYILGFMFLLFTYRKNWFKKWFSWLILSAGILTGTKSVALAFLLLLICWVFFELKSKKIKVLMISGLVILSLIGAYILFSSPIFSEIIRDDGWVSAVLSYRNELLLDKTLPFIDQNWNFWNYLFGGWNNPWLRPQMAVFDLLIYFGLIGGGLFLFLFTTHFFDFKLKGKFIFFCFVILFATAFITGNFFYNASVPIYLVALKYTIIGLNKEEINVN